MEWGKESDEEKRGIRPREIKIWRKGNFFPLLLRSTNRGYGAV